MQSTLAGGMEAFNPELRDRCRRAKEAVRLDDDMAMAILSVEVKKAGAYTPPLFGSTQALSVGYWVH